MDSSGVATSTRRGHLIPTSDWIGSQPLMMTPLASARLRDVARLVRDEPAIGAVLGRSAGVLAVPEPARAMVLAGLVQLSDRRPFVVAVPNSGAADQLIHDLKAFLPEQEIEHFGAWETLPFERISPSIETMGRRQRVLWRLRDPERLPAIIVTSARAVAQRLGPHAAEAEPIVIRPQQRLDTESLIARLAEGGYRREELVEHRGEFAVRGSIIDVFGATDDVPTRIDLWGDEVDRLTEFSVADQRSTVDLDVALIFPARELLATDDVRAKAEALMSTQPWGREQWDRLAGGASFEGMESWLPWLTDTEQTLIDVLPDTAQLVICEPHRLRARAADIVDEERDLARALSTTWGVTAEDFPRLHLPLDTVLADQRVPLWSFINAPESPDTPTISAVPWAPVVGDGKALVNRLTGFLTEGYRIVVAADGDGSATRLAAILRDAGVDLPIDLDGARDLTKAGGAVVVAPLHHGVVMPTAKVAILAEPDLTGRRRAHKAARPKSRNSVSTYEDLKPGSYIVHATHGVGRYEGMVKRKLGGVERDYLQLTYRDGQLFVPSDQIDALRQYIGGETPSMNRMGGSEFSAARAKVKSAVREIAQELVLLYQRRINAKGHSFAMDTVWQAEMEDAFGYVETPDQLTAIADVKADMEAEHPMDRLVCGDVGFGKTEVAVRAVFKAVQDGKQAAVLVPTTLLAQQHFATFSDRFRGFPVRVEVLSRFLTAGQAKKVIDGLATGEVDVVVGTHRLLAKDLRFKDLGLLVVDEEQRFGVTHKEAIKSLKVNVDVLTLSATPIPRTMEMALTGIRDLTLLQTPPADRQPILTYVGPYDDKAVAESIRRELLREGQVFYVHNRVRDIELKAAQLRELVPEARIAIAHGQMDEGSLEQVVVDFWEQKYDVLVCTTIIESGIDMPTVNTLVVERSDALGLGQLHQLRGRVGRSGQRAYAYLFHPADVALSEDAYERLKTIGEATELGSGFKIAMRDLEIRGAGNLLSETQSGHIAAVGYDLYCQMVNEVVSEMKGEPVRDPAEVKLDVPVAANLPNDYVAREELRLEAYRRLAAVTTHEEVDDIRAEWEDRYGPLPDPAVKLLWVAHLRAECHRTGIRDVMITTKEARLGPIELKASEQIRLRRIAKTALYKEATDQLVVPLKPGVDPSEFLIAFLNELRPAEPLVPA
jgi:transcription-repair coupling factor (superfamily II helicase)